MDRNSHHVDIELGESVRPNNGAFNIRFRSSDVPEFSLAVQGNSSVAELKSRIADQMNVPPNKYIRLIFNGKLLDPNTASLISFKLQEGSFVHCVITNRTQAAIVTPTDSLPVAVRVEEGLASNGFDSLRVNVYGGGTRNLDEDEVGVS